MSQDASSASRAALSLDVALPSPPISPAPAHDAPPHSGAADAASPALASPLPRYSALAADYNALPTYPSRPSYREFTSALSLRTQCVLSDGAKGDRFAPASVPIYQTATFVQPSATEFGPYDYTRSGNPTVRRRAHPLHSPPRRACAQRAPTALPLPAVLRRPAAHRAGAAGGDA